MVFMPPKFQLLLNATLKATFRSRAACSPLPLSLTALLLPSLLLTGCAGLARLGHKDMAYSDSLFVTMTFIEHTGEGAMRNYLAQNVHYPPVERLREDLEAKIGAPLKNRGEAHITVVTPVEYDNVLSPRLPIAKINEIARASSIQSLPFEPVCLGRGQVAIEGRDEQTYYIVVTAPKLVDLRRQIAKAFVDAGGDPAAFRAEDFNPHITVGFTRRDLHAEDGVVKDAKSCLYSLESAKR